MKSNSALSSQAASLNRRSPRSANDHRLDVRTEHALAWWLPEADMILPEPELRLHQLLRLAHQAGEQVDEGAAHRRATVEAQRRPVEILLTGQEVLDQLTAALGDVAEDRHHLVRRLRFRVRFKLLGHLRIPRHLGVHQGAHAASARSGCSGAVANSLRGFGLRSGGRLRPSRIAVWRCGRTTQAFRLGSALSARSYGCGDGQFDMGFLQAVVEEARVIGSIWSSVISAGRWPMPSNSISSAPGPRLVISWAV